ncbi:hypothetical protein [Streptomyces sp. NBC_01373]|uniref:hypothetical protein n=1 Tax=Streptomyces sp. NBC_01373 TaxID=2903843 RepID=UPI00225BDCA2|nr:hypothetical protein [Streptomyces sp. NBC_01373]MCX4706989.1 hypothetical protein [Streptomyces sp. NBC_01373]
MPAQAPHGSVDAAAFGTPHPSAGVEIWYLTGHMRDEDGQEHTWTLSILRHHDAQDLAAGPGYCLCVTHHGPAGLAYGTWITPAALRVVRQALDGDQAMDPRVRTALSEALAQGPLLPDRLLQQPVTEASGALDITVGDLAALRREEDGTFRLSFREHAQFDLVLTPAKPAVRSSPPRGAFPVTRPGSPRCSCPTSRSRALWSPGTAHGSGFRGGPGSSRTGAPPTTATRRPGACRT